MNAQGRILGTMDEIKRANHEANMHWFDRGAMRWFRSRVGEKVYPCMSKRGTYFVSSEQFDDNSPRLYSVRMADWETGEIDTVGEFQQYPTGAQAHRAARELARD